MNHQEFIAELAEIATGCEVFGDSFPPSRGEPTAVFCRSPLGSLIYFPDDGLMFLADGNETLSVRRDVHLDPKGLLSLLHIANSEHYRVVWQQGWTQVVAKMYRRIERDQMPQYADYLTDGDIVFANVGLQRCPRSASPDQWRTELHARVWSGLTYLYPTVSNRPHTWECGAALFCGGMGDVCPPCV